MKVAITHPYSWPEVRRGAERITVETGRALAAAGHDVTVFTAGAAHGRDRGDGQRSAVREVDVYACMSRYSLRVLEQDWRRGGVVIPGGVRLDEFAPARERAAEPTILFSGALTEPRKHLDTLLDAVALLSRREPDLRV